jgi:hypothetical protein
MEIQYIKDDNGQIAFAVVPIAIWENTVSQVNESAVQYLKSEKPFNLMDYYGAISIDMTDEQLFNELNQLRGEWDRDI